ncbi:uncharacterized protein LOC135684413 isoform X1 [Rhopilema esculentum]|uniref:uncharacterized protein LOC135684413 isoform X1 n=1 Tax=Rhopilema esculentum TaxID=499914 RepID=UPI0031CFD604
MELNYCKVCKLHCEHGKKHKYSAKHVALFNSLVKKFGSKVKECKKYLDFPEVISGEFEPSASFWCHFCEMKIPKHVTNRTFSIKFGGVFEHFASSAHTKKTHNFWKLNGGDTNLKKDFLISEEDYVTYKGRCKKALDNFAQEEDLSHMQAAEEIRSREAERLKIVSDQKHPSSSSSCEGRTVLNSHGVMQNHTGWHDGKRVWRGGIVKQGFRRRDLTKVSKGRKFGEEDSEHIHRTSSFLPTLSSVTPSKNAGKLVGNIHTVSICELIFLATPYLVIQGLFHLGCKMMTQTSLPLNLPLDHLTKNFYVMPRKNKRKNRILKASVQILITLQRRQMTGCRLSEEFGIQARDGSQGESIGKKNRRLRKRCFRGQGQR